jgi:hypothetical protein
VRIEMSRYSLAVSLLFFVAAFPGSAGQADARLQGAFRKPEEAGWIFVHLQGGPAEIGFQHGYLLAPEIEDARKAIELSTTHDVRHDWRELREVAKKHFLPGVPGEYREELEGMVAGAAAHGLKMDLLDAVAMNAFMEFSYYYGERERSNLQAANAPSIGEHCSAFVATGAYTKDGRIVIGHNNWSDYLSGSRWKIIFDIQPRSGHHLIMDGVAGLIHSGDDFGINDAGMMITETTIGSFHGFKDGVPEFVRARKAMQYAGSIDEFTALMKQGNNGGYANAWLIGDRKTNEIARLELGLKHVTLERTRDGFFVGSNFPIHPKLIEEETDFPIHDANHPNLVRLRRWNQLMAENKGHIDVEAGKRFETDHYDMVTRKVDPDERTLCGHIDRSSRGMKGWQNPYGPAGAVEAKVTDSAMVEKMSFTAGAGHPCGLAFHAKSFLKDHQEYSWQAPELQDLPANRWVVVAAASHP